MTKSKKDLIREEQIHNQVVVDAYGSEEQAIGRYYYLEDKIRFPFQAKCIVAKVVSPLLKGEAVEVQGMAPEDACSADILVLIPLARPEHGSLVSTATSQGEQSD